MNPALILLEILERDLKPDFYDGMSRDEQIRLNRAFYRHHCELRARTNGKPPQTAALFGIRISPRQEIRA